MDPDAVVAIVAIVFWGVAAVAGIVAYTVIRLVDGKRKYVSNEEESRLIQEIHQGLLKMEHRVESLETLLLEREPKGREHAPR